MLKPQALKKNGIKKQVLLKLKLMEKNFDFIELSDFELKEINGGVLPMLLIRLFEPNIGGLLSFWNGVKDGYNHTTQP